MATRQIVGIIFAFLAGLSLLYLIIAYWNNYSTSNIDSGIVAFLVTVSIAGLCLYTGKSKP